MQPPDTDVATLPAPLHPAQLEMAEAMPHVVWTARRDGRVEWISAEFARNTGLTPEDIAEGGWIEAIHPQDRLALYDAWQEAITRKMRFRASVRLWSAAKGGWRMYLVDTRPHLNPDRTVSRWYGMAIDIQNQHEIEQARTRESAVQRLEIDILRMVSTDRPLSEMLETICAEVDAILADAITSIILISPEGVMTDIFGGGLPAEYTAAITGLRIGEQQGSCGTAAHRRQLVVVENIATDPLWADYRDLAAEHGLMACWSLPVVDSSGRCLATFAFYYRTPRAPTAEEIALLRRVGEFVRLAFERTADRDRLRENELRYRTLFDLLPVSVWEEDVSGILDRINDIKASGVTDYEAWLDANPGFINEALKLVRVLDVNRAALDIHGAPDRATLQAFFSTESQTAGVRASFRQHLLSLFRNEPLFENLHSFRRNDGRWTDLLVRLLLPEGQNGRLLVTELDVTEQRRAVERFRIVAQATSDVIFERDYASGLTWVSEGLTSQFGHPGLAGGHPRSFWAENIHPDDRDAVLELIDAATDGDAEGWNTEYRFCRADGQYVPVSERAVIRRDADGTVRTIIGSMVDLSRQKALEEQLRQSQRLDAIGQLTGGVAHDFNNLLMVILGNADLLLDGMVPDGAARSMVDNILRASEKAAELTSRLLAFARKQPLSPKLTDLNGLVVGMQPLLSRALTAEIALELDLSPEAWPVQIDAPMFENALLNLCVNSRDAMPQGGRLRIATRNVTLPDPAPDDPAQPKSGPYLCITVSDTGEGMDELTRSRMFEPFFTTKPVGKGSGLGLSMVYGFVRQSQGHVRVDTAPAGGTAISILLPRTEGTPSATPDESETDARLPERSARILLVEDDTLVRVHVRNLMMGLGHRVTDVPGPQEALAVLATGSRFDIVVSDVVMPGGMNGRQLAARIAQLYPGLPVLLTSGHSRDAVLQDGVLEPGIAFLQKPYRRRELADRIRDLIGA